MSASEREIASLITEIEEGRLQLRPAFQRRLVWTIRDKEYFLDTVLKGLPFPEIFISTDKVDTAKRTVKKWLIDGQQRISTLRDYIQGTADLFYRDIQPYANLDPEKQQAMLHYKVAVRDLGLISDEDIKEIFNRINATDYSLKKMEKMNALYSGIYKRYCVELSEHDFFMRHKVFRQGGDKRMGDVTFCVILVTTLQCGYYRRDEKNEEYLRRYNDDFPDKERIQAELDRVFDFIDRCNLPPKSRAWKHTDLFTLLVEIHSAIITQGQSIDPSATGLLLGYFYDQVTTIYKQPGAKHNGALPVSKDEVLRYLKAGTKATNDKYARVERAEVISKLLSFLPNSEDNGSKTDTRKRSGGSQ